MIIIDSHCDTPSQILRLRDMGKEERGSHVDFPKLRRGGVTASFFAMFSPVSMTEEQAHAHAKKMISSTKAAVESHPEAAFLATGAADVDAALESGRTAIFFGMENGSPIGDSIGKLEEFHSLGIRYLTLTHNADNLIADSAAQASRWGGLSPFGREVVAKMNEMGMLIDLAHASDKTFFDCIRLSKAPVVSTHSCCRALCSHRRNMTDEMLRAISDCGGVMQVNFYPAFLSDDFCAVLDDGLFDKFEEIENRFIEDPADPCRRDAWADALEELRKLQRPGIDRVVDHIEHAAEVAGIDSVGIGSDFDGICVTPDGLEDVSKIGMVFDAMLRRGFTREETEKVAGLNFLRVLRQICP